jgi:hypothetical protein
MPRDPSFYYAFLMLVVVVVLFVLCVIGVETSIRNARRNKQVFSPSRQRKTWGLLFFLLLMMLIVLCYSWLHDRKESTARHIMLAYVPFVLLSAYMAFRPRTAREDLQNWVCDTRHCGRCGYDLTGNVSGICPECGTPIPDSPKQIQKPWWGAWWLQWHIDYLDNWRKTLAFAVVTAIFCAALALWIAIRWHEWSVLVFFGLISVIMAINCIRIVQYGRRIGGRWH